MNVFALRVYEPNKQVLPKPAQSTCAIERIQEFRWLSAGRLMIRNIPEQPIKSPGAGGLRLEDRMGD